MTTAKNAVFIGLELRNCCLVGVGNWLLVGEIKIWLWGVGGGWVAGGVTPPTPNRENSAIRQLVFLKIMLTFSQNCEELWSENGVTTLAKTKWRKIVFCFENLNNIFIFQSWLLFCKIKEIITHNVFYLNYNRVL